MIPEKLSIRLADSDLFLFTNGGCHIFARQLLFRLPDEGYVAKQVVQIRPSGRTDCFHLFLQSGIYGVDGLGIHRIDDLLASLYGRPRHNPEWTYQIESVSLAECFEIDNNRSSEKLQERGAVNKWNMFLNPEFVEQVAKRAEYAIAQCPQRYSVAMLLKGHSLAKAAI